MEGDKSFEAASSDEGEHPIERQRRMAAARGYDVDEFASFHADDLPDDDRAHER